MTTEAGAVLVMGAGSVGCYVGGCLAAAGVPVILVGRPRVLDAIAQHGLTLSDIEGAARTLAGSTLQSATAVRSCSGSSRRTASRSPTWTARRASCPRRHCA